jgi:hypothetical protein
MLNGTPLGTNQDNFVNAAQLGRSRTRRVRAPIAVVRASAGSTAPGRTVPPASVSDPPQLQTVQPGETLELPPLLRQRDLAGATGRLKLDDPASFSGTVAE